MGIRSSRLQEDSVSGAVQKDGGVKRESFRRIRSSRPVSLALDFSSSRSRSEEGSDSDTGHCASPSVDPGTGVTEDRDDELDDGEESPGSPNSSDRFSPDEPVGGVPQRSSSERLAGARRLSSGRSGSARSVRVRSARPVSESWIGLYRVRHTMRCPFCNKTFPGGGRIEEHLLTCLTSPPLPYNADVLSKDSGECSICLEDLLQGETIARLACLCVYHKTCIDSWSSVKACCPEHPFD
ncbi:E3 ubiquitin-protein ligase ZNRF1 isoform X2 [Trichomycterus rosablanca]|uniref:E3 ubiquitin-protein ligase ZNRF1 isoform X2 n=1 Tax=Trichomycterus rosablanca TaxID=2290929 RepID=UPI002F35ABA6